MNTLKAQIEAYFLTDPAAQQEPYNRDYAMAHFCDANGDLVGVAYWANQALAHEGSPAGKTADIRKLIVKAGG